MSEITVHQDKIKHLAFGDVNFCKHTHTHGHKPTKNYQHHFFISVPTQHNHF